MNRKVKLKENRKIFLVVAQTAYALLKYKKKPLNTDYKNYTTE